MATESELHILYQSMNGKSITVEWLHDFRTLDYLPKYDVVVFTETHVAKDQIAEVEAVLPDKFNWGWDEALPTEKGNQGGILIGVDTKWQIGRLKIRKNWVAVELKKGEIWTWVVGVYDQGQSFTRLTHLSQFLRRHKDNPMILVGDLTARIGTLGSFGDGYRTTKDPVIDQKGRDWFEYLQRYKLRILNGNVPGDKKGWVTHARNLDVVSDYGTANNVALEKYLVDMKLSGRGGSSRAALQIACCLPGCAPCLPAWTDL